MVENIKKDISKEIHELLELEFQPNYLKVINESHFHAGHAEAGNSGNSHFKVQISSDKLANNNRIMQHKAIYATLEKLINNPIHALAIEIL